MLNLNDREWKPFFLTELFPVIQRGKRLKSENHIPGEMPYISSSALCNGVDNFISNTEKVRIFSNCISLANSGSVGSSFYEPFSFVASDHVTHLKNEKYNKYHYLFIVSIMNRLSQKYNFNREINDNRISREKIMLPIDSEGNLDLYFMEQYIKEREGQLIQKYKDFISKNKKSGGVRPDLKSVKWKAFYIEDICDIESGCDIYDAERISGSTPYITSSAMNNGIKYFVGNNNVTLESNCISVNRNGSVGYSFYHKYPALYSNDCRKLRLKKHNNEYAALFMTNQVMQQKDKYNYSIKMGTARLKKQKIMLPVDDHGEPDYNFMERYIKELESQLIQKYEDFI